MPAISSWCGAANGFPCVKIPIRYGNKIICLNRRRGVCTALRAVYHTAAPVVVTATPTTLFAEEERDLAVLYGTAQTLHNQPRLRAQLAVEIVHYRISAWHKCSS